MTSHRFDAAFLSDAALSALLASDGAGCVVRRQAEHEVAVRQLNADRWRTQQLNA